MNAAIIVAAGRGTRMGHNIDKLFLELAGIPVIAHSWGTFDSCPFLGEIVLVVREGMQGAFEDLAAERRFSKPFRLVAGGKERQDSVWNGVQALSPETGIVAIHDGARPCVSQDLISRTIDAAAQFGAAVAAQPVTDTIKESADGLWVCRNVDRSRLWAVQTPQTFRVAVIREALLKVRQSGTVVTDDTAACELAGHPVRMVACAEPNPKVTRQQDLPVIEALLKSRCCH